MQIVEMLYNNVVFVEWVALCKMSFAQSVTSAKLPIANMGIGFYFVEAPILTPKNDCL